MNKLFETPTTKTTKLPYVSIYKQMDADVSPRDGESWSSCLGYLWFQDKDIVSDMSEASFNLDKLEFQSALQREDLKYTFFVYVYSAPDLRYCVTTLLKPRDWKLVNVGFYFVPESGSCVRGCLDNIKSVQETIEKELELFSKYLNDEAYTMKLVDAEGHVLSEERNFYSLKECYRTAISCVKIHMANFNISKEQGNDIIKALEESMKNIKED